MRSRVAALRTRRLERQRGELLEDVGLLQAALLPVPPARLGPVGTSVAYRPADGPGAGGDFYDVFALEDGRLAVIVGDVSGHGREALPHTALVRFTLRAYLEAGQSPRERRADGRVVLERQLGGSFATVVAATYNPRERTLIYACAGHPPPLVLGVPRPRARSRRSTSCSAPPIGVGMRTGTRQTVVSVPGRAQICFHTDGVTEARVGGELFGSRAARADARGARPEAPARRLLDARRRSRPTRAPTTWRRACSTSRATSGAPAVLVEESSSTRGGRAARRTERFLLACGLDAAGGDARDRAARASSRRAGAGVLELRFDDGAPEVASLRADNVDRCDSRPRARPSSDER